MQPTVEKKKTNENCEENGGNACESCVCSAGHGKLRTGWIRIGSLGQGCGKRSRGCVNSHRVLSRVIYACLSIYSVMRLYMCACVDVCVECVPFEMPWTGIQMLL